MQRVLVSGISGAGKSTIAREMSRRLGLPYAELDALHHGPGWVKRPEFEADVESFTSGARWITEDQYSSFLGTLLWERADTFIWLDLPRPVVMARVVRRSAARAVSRRELWNGNRESWRRWADADHPIRWAWSRHAYRRARTAAQLADPLVGHLEVHHLRTPSDVRRFLRTLPIPPHRNDVS